MKKFKNEVLRIGEWHLLTWNKYKTANLTVFQSTLTKALLQKLSQESIDKANRVIKCSNTI